MPSVAIVAQVELFKLRWTITPSVSDLLVQDKSISDDDTAEAAKCEGTPGSGVYGRSSRADADIVYFPGLTLGNKKGQAAWPLSIGEIAMQTGPGVPIQR